jgi:hypothetical protein
MDTKPTLLMKNALSLILLLATTTPAFAQGKLAFVNNSDQLIYMTTDKTTMVPADANRVVGGLPLAGSSLYTGAGGTIAALAGAPSFTVALFAGATANSLSMVAVGGLGNVDFGGFINPQVNVTLPGLPAGTPAFFQIQVYDSRSRDAYDAMSAGLYYGTSPIFQATPQTSVYSPIYQRTPPVNSTWAPGKYVPVDYSGFPGYYGGISVQVMGCLGPYFIQITPQPTSQTVILGATAAFQVGATACPRPNYQWYFNGVAIPGATDSSFQIANAQLINAGAYYAVLSNPFWGSQGGVIHTSASATLTVLVKPTITSPPQTQTAETGSTVGFYVNATNTLPLSYQWCFNGTLAITGSTTNCALLLTNVQPSQAGAYTVVVTNIAGVVTSPPAMLNVIAAVERRPVPGVKMMGQTASMLNLDYANALSLAPNWNPLGSVSLTSTSQYYFDLTLPLPPQRYYQAWQTGAPVVIPSLDLHLVPAITLTGNIGNSVRLDCINQFGPTDAWFTLDAVTLTNTSQLYFDTSAWRQPERLYRLVQVP